MVALFHAVTIGDLIAQAGTHPQLLCDVFDGKKRPGNLLEAGMVIEDRGHAVANGVQDGGIGACARPIEAQVAVDVPPLLLKVLQEVMRIAALDGKTARKAGIDMRVAVDQAWHDDAVMSIKKLCVRIGCLKLRATANSNDLVSLYRYGSIFDVRFLCIARHHSTVDD